MYFYTGKDAAGIAMEAIRFANDAHIDIVLVDTAGRMQDNEPLMRALAKLIKVHTYKDCIISRGLCQMIIMYF